MRELSNTACIVGAAESDEMGVLPHKSQMALHLESISNACADAGLKVSDIDGVFTAGAHSPALIAEALGVRPRYVDGTTVGGCLKHAHQWSAAFSSSGGTIVAQLASRAG